MASNRISKQPSGQVSLLDRLSDSSAHSIAETTLQRGEQPEFDLEMSIKRDIEWLLNSTSYSAIEDLSRWKNVEKSILNYGVHVTPGRMLTNADAPQIENAIRLAICRFEPRVRRDTLTVKAYAEEINPHRLAIAIVIDGDYMVAGQWIGLSMTLQMDSETGLIQSTNARAG